MTGLDAAAAALFARCDGDAGPLGDGAGGLRQVVGVDGTGQLRLAPEWPNEDMARADFPRGTVTLLEWPTGAGVYRVRATLDWWAWALGGDPDAQLAAIDRRCLALFDGTRWTHGGAWFSSTLMPASSIPVRSGGRSRLARRTRELALLVQII